MTMPREKLQAYLEQLRVSFMMDDQDSIAEIIADIYGEGYWEGLNDKEMIESV